MEKTGAVTKGDEKLFSSTNVAFFAGQSSDVAANTQTYDFAFDNVVTNVGDAFKGGKFIAPVSATYQFNITISAQKGKKAAVNVMQSTNSEPLMTMTSVSPAESVVSTSGVAILTLGIKEKVWLKVLSGSDVCGGMNTSFSGCILF